VLSSAEGDTLNFNLHHQFSNHFVATISLISQWLHLQIVFYEVITTALRKSGD